MHSRRENKTSRQSSLTYLIPQNVAVTDKRPSFIVGRYDLDVVLVRNVPCKVYKFPASERINVAADIFRNLAEKVVWKSLSEGQHVHHVRCVR
jgi:hypothetical protein